ncbi:MAG: cytochrome P450 [Pseudonocardia sp.]|nr:cytochrome P450 [Pseudonocardia sp.]
MSYVRDVVELTSRPVPRFELCSGETWRSPWEMYAALRAHDPVHHVVPADQPERDYWVLSRHGHVFAAVRDSATYSSRDGLTVTYGELEDLGLTDNPPMVMQDPPAHTALRRLLAHGFTPRQVGEVEPAVRRFVVERLMDLREQGGGDIVEHLFKPLPSMVVAHYLGVPAADRPLFDRWTHAMMEGAAGQSSSFVSSGHAEMLGFLVELIKRRRREPGDDSVSLLVGSGMAGDDADTRGLVQVLAYAWTMIAGGNDTTTGLLAEAVRLLQRHPDQRARLVAEPGRIPVAVEEFARLACPVQGLARTLTRDVELAGKTVPAGRKVLLLFASANRDERVYGPDAEELDIHRDPQKILTFGHGSHHCLGAAAARMQARVVLEEILTRFPWYTVDLDAVRYAPGPYIRRPTTLPFRGRA